MSTLAVSLISLGCPKNLVDAEIMLGHLPPERYTITTDEAAADIIVVNTCAFIEDAREESVDTILEVADYKKTGNCKMLIVCGCMPQRYQEELSKELPEVDLLMGTGDAPRLVELIEEQLGRPEQRTEIGTPDYLYDHNTPRALASPFYTSYIKIADGCDNNCSYCVIPSLRGTLRSRTMQSVVAEAQSLVEKGVKEINLIAQDITAYGADLGGATNIEALLPQLVKIEGLEWIRLLYAYPEGISDRLIELIATEEKICNYLDVPLQHIDNDILQQMNRRLDEKGTRALVKKLRERIPDLTLRTSFIVGFPGESAAQFEKLLKFVSEGHFERVGAFRYSREEGTPAATMKRQVPDRSKNARQRRLMKAQARVSFRKNRGLVGQVESVLVEGYSEETELLLKGRSVRQAPDVDGQVYITAGQADVGDIVPLVITDSSEYDLIGEIQGALDD